MLRVRYHHQYVEGNKSLSYIRPRFHQPMLEAIVKVGRVLSACINPAVSNCETLESSRKTSFEHRMSYKHLFEYTWEAYH